MREGAERAHSPAPATAYDCGNSWCLVGDSIEDAAFSEIGHGTWQAFQTPKADVSYLGRGGGGSHVGVPAHAEDEMDGRAELGAWLEVDARQAVQLSADTCLFGKFTSSRFVRRLSWR